MLNILLYFLFMAFVFWLLFWVVPSLTELAEKSKSGTSIYIIIVMVGLPLAFMYRCTS